AYQRLKSRANTHLSQTILRALSFYSSPIHSYVSHKHFNQYHLHSLLIH
ncbi:hypothetical protein Zm00014a_001123, partial [Zea mays]